MRKPHPQLKRSGTTGRRGFRSRQARRGRGPANTVGRSLSTLSLEPLEDRIALAANPTVTAPDLVQFAQDLSDAGVLFFGAAWCPHCTAQKALFEDGAQHLLFIEVTNPDRTPNEIGIEEGITSYPTWERIDGARLTGVQSLAALSAWAGVPIPQGNTPDLFPIGDQFLSSGAPLHVALDGYDPNGDALTYTVSSSNPNVQASVLGGNRSLVLDVSTYGKLVYQLFEQRARRATQNIITLVQQGFYNGLIYHRIVDGFVLQAAPFLPGGTPRTSPIDDWDDDFDNDLQHVQGGLLSAANAGDDTNNASFFSTQAAARHLDFDHSVLGFLTEGANVHLALGQVPVKSSQYLSGELSEPITDLVINSATIFADTENGVLVLKAAEGYSGVADITVTATDENGHQVSRTFRVNVAADNVDSNPYLDDINEPVVTKANTAVNVQLGAQDVEGDAVYFDVAPATNSNHTLSINHATGLLTVTPTNAFVGTFQVLVGVRADAGGRFDTQQFTVQVNPAAPTAVDLLAASDTGASSTDNLTNAQSMTFQVNGVTSGALVKLFRNGSQIGSATATGTTVQIVVSGAATLAEGTHNITATQTISGLASTASPPLVVTVDRTAPANLSNTPPGQAIAGTAYAFDASHAEDPNVSYSLPSAPAGMTINATTGVVSWTPAAGQAGQQSFQIRTTDRAGNTQTQTFLVQVLSGLPAGADNYAATEDTPLVVSAAGGVLANDGDGSSGTLSATLLTGPTHGTLTLNSNGSFTYTPAANYFGGDSFTYRASDGVRQSGSTTATIQVAGVNDAPVAANDAYSTSEDTTLSVNAAAGVRANDTDVDGNPLSVALVSGPTHGQLTLNSDGSFSYTPAANYFGADSFTYRTNDGTVNSNTATVNLTINSVNDPPNTQNDSYSVNEDTVLTVGAAGGVLANDSDVEGSPLTATVVNGPASGTLSLAANGSFTYTPAVNFHGTDTFTYRASDGSAQSGLTTVTINVNPVNDPTVAVDDSYSVDEDTVLNVSAAGGVLANDVEVDGDPLVVSLVEGPASGQLTLGTGGSFTYTPVAEFSGQVHFKYKVYDGTADSNEASVTIAVNAVNDPPVAQADSYTLDEDQTLTIAAAGGVLANDSDVEGSPLTAAVVSGPSHGTLSLAADGSFTYTPAANFNGMDSFTYRASDGAAPSAVTTVTLTINPVNDPTVAVDDAYSLDEDTTLDVSAVAGVLANDVEVDGDPLIVSLVEGPASGQLTLNSNGSFSYVPAANFNGQVSFRYKVNDGSADSNEATVTVTVNSVNDPPVAAPDGPFTIDEDTTLIVSASSGLLVNDSDVEGDPLTTVLVAGAAHGQVTVHPDGSFSYTPQENFFGADAFRYVASDGASQSSPITVTVNVTPVDDPPQAIGDQYTLDEDSVLSVLATGGVLQNDLEVDGEPLTATLVWGPSHGQLTFNTDGSFSYAPEANYFGSDEFTYVASDGLSNSNVTTVSLSIQAVNDAPVGTIDAYELDEDTMLAVLTAQGVLANDSDIEGDPLAATLIEGPAHGTLSLNPNGSFTYTPAADFNGADTFTYRAADAQDSSSEVVVTFLVHPVDDPPRFAPIAPQTVVSSLELTFPAGATDPDNSGVPIVYTLESGAPEGATIDATTGQVRWTPPVEAGGEFTLIVRATKVGAEHLTSTTTVGITVIPLAALAAADAPSNAAVPPSGLGGVAERAAGERLVPAAAGNAVASGNANPGDATGIATGQFGPNVGISQTAWSGESGEGEANAEEQERPQDGPSPADSGSGDPQPAADQTARVSSTRAGQHPAGSPVLWFVAEPQATPEPSSSSGKTAEEAGTLAPAPVSHAPTPEAPAFSTHSAHQANGAVSPGQDSADPAATAEAEAVSVGQSADDEDPRLMAKQELALTAAALISATFAAPRLVTEIKRRRLWQRIVEVFFGPQR